MFLIDHYHYLYDYYLYSYYLYYFHLHKLFKYPYKNNALKNIKEQTIRTVDKY